MKPVVVYVEGGSRRKIERLRFRQTRDAPTLLERLDSRRVAARCRGCARLFAALREAP